MLIWARVFSARISVIEINDMFESYAHIGKRFKGYFRLKNSKKIISRKSDIRMHPIIICHDRRLYEIAKIQNAFELCFGAASIVIIPMLGCIAGSDYRTIAG